MRFKGLDLNLLVAFLALIEERNVSRAAERLNLSQPAMSAALARLREYFSDRILVAQGKRMYPTAFAESLLPQVRETLSGIETLIATSQAFDPASSQRTFRMAASDYITVSVLVPLISALATEAPGVRIDLQLPGEGSARALDAGEIDLLLTPDMFTHPNHPADLLFEERHVIVGWADNPIFREPMSEDAFYASGHVTVAFGTHRALAFADRELERLGRPRRVEVIAPSFTAVAWLLLGTPRLALMHERLARSIGDRFPIATAPLPFDFPPMREMAQYHSARAEDEGLRWIRSQLARAASST